MSIEVAIKNVIDGELENGIIERLVAENLEKGINNAIGDLLGSYGDVTKIIRDKIKEVMVEQLSLYDYSKYIVNLDYTLTEILKKTSLDNKKILENFKELMTDSEIPKIVKASGIFEEFTKYVSDEVDTSDLEIDYDDTPSYQCVDVTMEVEFEDERSWSSYKYAKIIFECKQDEELNCEIRISRYNDGHWNFIGMAEYSINSLRYLGSFELYLLKLNQANVKIEIDCTDMTDEVEPEAEPEADFR